MLLYNPPPQGSHSGRPIQLPAPGQDSYHMDIGMAIILRRPEQPLNLCGEGGIYRRKRVCWCWHRCCGTLSSSRAACSTILPPAQLSYYGRHCSRTNSRPHLSCSTTRRISPGIQWLLRNPLVKSSPSRTYAGGVEARCAPSCFSMMVTGCSLALLAKETHKLLLRALGHLIHFVENTVYRLS